MFDVDSDKILNLMLEQKLSVNALAQKAGVSYESVWKLLNGTNRVGIPIISKIAAALDVSPRSLMFRKE